MLSRRALMITAAASGLAVSGGPGLSGALARQARQRLGSQVDPMIGTGGHGHVYPGATMPFGMVQLSPDTDNARWDASSGYYHDDTTLLGFSHTHLSGTGVGDMLDLLVVPALGEVRLRPGTLAAPEGSYRTRMDHAAETAQPGYYSLLLPETGIRCELTATERTGLHRYTFPAGKDAHLLIDWAHGSQDNEAHPCKVTDAHLKLIGRDTLVGSRRVSQWAGGRVIHFALKLSRPFTMAQFYSNDRPLQESADRADGAALKCVLKFGQTLDAPLLVKVGLSAVDIDGALNNLGHEAPGFDFDGVRSAAAAAWEMELARIRIDTPSDVDRRIFYSALYHAQLAPTLFSDVDGRYRAMDTTVRQLNPNQRNYSTYSLWDTYRAWHPLMTLIAPDHAAEFARNLIDMGLESPNGPCIWPLQGIETFCMIGWHSAVVIAEALHKRLPGVDARKAWSVYKDLAFSRPAGLIAYRDKGYVPCDVEDQSVSKTLEYAYDDWAMAVIADAADDPSSAKALRARSKNYRNVFDPKLQFVRPRNADGGWAEPFDPRGMGHNPTVWWDYTECNSWQATFLNQHDIYSYIQLFGGDAAFEAKLDALFNASSDLPPDAPPDMSGLIGQYVHGNEPSHHIAYLYAFCGAHYKAQSRVRMLLKSQYRAKPDGIAGNEDCGQMSAWHILSSLGFYPVDPVSGVYVFGAPLFPRADIGLPGGKTLSIIAEGVDDDHVYIHAVTRNGKPYAKSWISHADLMSGGELRFTMSIKPNIAFGADRADRPPSFSLVE